MSGGLTSDVSAGAKVSFGNEYGTSGEASFEASVRRGSKFSAKAEQNFKPFSEKYDKMVNDQLGPLNEIYKVDTSLTKEIWSGTYSF